MPFPLVNYFEITTVLELGNIKKKRFYIRLFRRGVSIIRRVLFGGL